VDEPLELRRERLHARSLDDERHVAHLPDAVASVRARGHDLGDTVDRSFRRRKRSFKPIDGS
jgi:hypothetical protein